MVDRTLEDAVELATFEVGLGRSTLPIRGAVADDDLQRILGYVRARRARRRTAATRAEAPRPGSDRDPGPTAAADPGLVTGIEEVGPTVRILRVVRSAGLRFDAGQHLRAGVVGGRQAKFSLASAPHEDPIELCVQLVVGGRTTPSLFEVRVGDHLELDATAKGGFRLDLSATTHLMIATATGIAPLRSMVRDAAHRGNPARFVIRHGASHLDELPYRSELADDPAVDYVATVSRPTEARSRGWDGPTGRVDALARAAADQLDPATTRAYLCGNRDMVRQLGDELRQRGFAVSTESYGPGAGYS